MLLTKASGLWKRYCYIDSITGIPYSGQILLGWRDTLYEFFDSTTHNLDVVSNYTTYYDMFEQYGMATIYIWIWADGVIRTEFDLQGQGLRNGDGPSSVYSLFGNWGTQYTGQSTI